MNTLTLQCIEFEKNAETESEYLYLRSSVSSHGFAGGSDFWVDRTEFDRFIAELESFTKKKNGDVILRCGWGEDVYFQVKFSWYDSLGHVQLYVELGKPSHGGGMHKVTTTIEIDQSSLIAFIESIRKMLIRTEKEEIVLSGCPNW